MDAHSTTFLDYSLYAKSLRKLPEKPPLLINTINQYSYCIAQKDEAFKKALQGSDVLLPDGMAVVLAARMLTGQKLKKIAGYDLHRHMLWDLNNRSGSCFYLGASPQTLKKIKRKVGKYYPNVKVETYSPPFKKEFTEEDNRLMIGAVNKAQPDVLFVGMTAPKQEKWAFEHKDQLNVKAICTIGAVFDFFAGTVRRPGKAWINFGLEWFIRLAKEPKRLWRRYLYYGPVFIGMMLKEKARLMLHGNQDKASKAGADTKTLFPGTTDEPVIARRAG